MYGKRGICGFLVLWALCLRWLCGARVVIVFHELYNEWGHNPLQALVSFIHRIQFFALGASANELIFTTERRRELGQRWFSWKKSRIHCVPVGSNIEPVPTPAHDLEEMRRRYRGDARHLICTFGMLQRGVQFEELLQAFAGLVTHDRLDARLLFIGDWTHSELVRRQKLQSLVSSLGLSDRVLWSGPQPDENVSALLSISDLYLCYRADGPTTRSGTLAAALTHGLPVVANRCADLDPAFADGRTVLLFDDARGLREACRRLLSDTALSEQYSQHARAFAASRLTWSKIAEQNDTIWRHENSKFEIRNPKQIRMTEIRNHA